MSADHALSRELKSLHEEVSTTRRKRRSPKPEPAAAEAPPPEPTEDAADLHSRSDQFHGFVTEVTEFFDHAEKNIVEHPRASVVGALVVGILIGRFIGRR